MIYVCEDIWSFDLEAGLEEISEQRREQALKFRHEQGQRLCVLAYQLLKQGLKEPRTPSSSITSMANPPS